MAGKRLPLPRRFNAALTEEAYARLRTLNSDYGLGNNYLLTVLLERLDDIVDEGRMRAAFDDFIEDYGAPGGGGAYGAASRRERSGEDET